MTRWLLCLAALAATLAPASAETRHELPVNTPFPETDEHFWLEEVTGERALRWVKERDAESVRALGRSRDFKALEARLLAILDSKEKIPEVVKQGDRYYNFWRDAEHERGLWRRTSLEEYRKAAPAWEAVLDLDALGREEKENWVWKGATCLEPDHRRCLLRLSRGGADAVVVREFDVVSKAFVADGFVLPEAKSSLNWIDQDTVFVATDFGPGSMTNSGYPRLVKRWRRGTPLAAAEVVFEGQAEDVSVGAYKDFSPGHEKELVSRAVSFFARETFILLGGKRVRLEVPLDAEVTPRFDRLFVTLRSDWTIGCKTYLAGSLLVGGFDAFLAGRRDFSVLFTPGERSSLAGFQPLGDAVLVSRLDNVRSGLELWREVDGKWSAEPVGGLSEFATASVSAVDAYRSDDYWLTVTEFLTPTSLYLAAAGAPRAEPLKRLPSFFDATGLEVGQFEAVSKDGTKVPYFQVARRGLKLDGSNPTLLHGYGGFKLAQKPNYAARVGAAWLEPGNVYVVANIRGGGEFGPRWHQAALKEKRPRAYEDFIAVGEDLVRRGVTSPRRLGVMGGSNGGLLVGNMLTMRPDLFGAVVCQVPLLDMRRYSKLLAGASWMEEYGDPDDPLQWEFMRGFSPYHNLKPGVKYPAALFTTSTRDDRVHPGHARKMVARLIEMGQPVYYYENVEGGHGRAANNKQSAFMGALEYSFLRRELAGR